MILHKETERGCKKHTGPIGNLRWDTWRQVSCGGSGAAGATGSHTVAAYSCVIARFKGGPAGPAAGFGQSEDVSVNMGRVVALFTEVRRSSFGRKWSILVGCVMYEVPLAIQVIAADMRVRVE